MNWEEGENTQKLRKKGLKIDCTGGKTVNFTSRERNKAAALTSVSAAAFNTSGYQEDRSAAFATDGKNAACVSSFPNGFWSNFCVFSPGKCQLSLRIPKNRFFRDLWEFARKFDNS